MHVAQRWYLWDLVVRGEVGRLIRHTEHDELAIVFRQARLRSQRISPKDHLIILLLPSRALTRAERRIPLGFDVHERRAGIVDPRVELRPVRPLRSVGMYDPHPLVHPHLRRGLQFKAEPVVQPLDSAATRLRRCEPEGAEPRPADSVLGVERLELLILPKRAANASASSSANQLLRAT